MQPFTAASIVVGLFCGAFVVTTIYLRDEYDVEFHIHIPNDAWEAMSNCSFEEYKSEDRPAKCDYQDAQCTLLTSHRSVTSSCEVRRKGSGSWQPMNKKPSFKIKKFEDAGDDVDFGTFACDLCPPGTTENVWSTNKVTLNNQYQGKNEVKAYDVFRRVVPASLAVQARVSLFKGDVLQRTDPYVMLETIDDKKFMKKWFGSNYVLYEFEFKWWKKPVNNDHNRYVEYERHDGDSISEKLNVTDPMCTKDKKSLEACEETILESSARDTVFDLGLRELDNDAILKYWAAEVATNHWDGACVTRNNFYVAYNGTRYFYVPSGLDQTFQHHIPKAFSNNYCPFVDELLQDADTNLRFETLVEDLKAFAS
jgi:hypothetical protein